MSANTEQLDQQNVPDVLNMSEDELSRLDISQYLNQGSENPEDGQPEETTENQPTTEVEPEEEVVETDPEQVEEPEVDPENPEPTDEPAQQSEEGKAKDKAPAKETSKAKTDPESQNVPDHKAFYESIVGKPFKANGRDITVQSPEEVIKLMQMGANYHEKMAALKPTRRIMKMLENENLLNEQELGFLIDLHKKDPKAIAKLVQDSGIDLMDFDVEQGAGYQSQHQAPPESQIELADTVQELQNNPGFKEVLTHVTSAWDAASQDFIANNPGLLRVLDAQKSSGNFDLIANEVQRQKVLGQLVGMNSLQAHAAVEQQLQAQGLLKVPGVQPAPAKDVVVPPAKAAPKKETVNAKKAAAAPKQTVQSKPAIKGENLFSLSDEEFAKIDPTQFR